MGEKLPAQAYEIMEQRDEDQILAEIQGSIITEMFYSFKVAGKEVTGVSWVGTKEIARQYGNVRMDFIDLKDMGESFMAIVRATDTRTDTGMLGTSTQAKQMEIHDLDAEKRWLKDANGNYVTHLEPDKFASTKAVSKAQRNAIRAIIPEKFLIEMYKQFKQGLDKKPEPRRKVDAEAKPTASPGPVRYEVPEKKPEPVFDDEERRIMSVLEANNLPLTDIMVEHQGNRVLVHAGAAFPREMKADYDMILKMVKGRWMALENRWEVPVE